jgi:hypothetical protein
MEGGTSETQIDYTTIGLLRKRLNSSPKSGQILNWPDEDWVRPTPVGLVPEGMRDLGKTQPMKPIALFALAAEVLCGALLMSGPAVAVADGNGATGMVWEKHGDWHLNGSPNALRLGEAIPPGGLLTADVEGPAHSIVILLPDGQRMLCECYEAKTCSQGFRVPAITPQPQPAVWEMFVAVRNVLLLRPAMAETALPTPAGRATMAVNSEMVAAVNPQGEISIAPALRVLPSGQYGLRVATDGQTNVATAPAVQPLDWSAAQKVAQVRVGGPGLYRIRVLDKADVPRFEIEVLATSPASLPAEAAGLKMARETILKWTHEGWPLHGFLRVYLESRLSAPSH